MTAYQPTSRRPIAGALRKTASGPVRWCVRHGVHPDAISYSSIVAAGAAGLCFGRAFAVPWLLLAAVAFCFLRLWFNMLDGMVALAGGTASATGEIVNELPDRISDVIIFVGVAHGGLCHPLSGYWAAILSLLVAYVGVLGQAVGARREFGGLMSKPWRMVTLGVGALITLGLLSWGEGRIRYAGLTVLDWTCLVIIAGALQTIGVRLARTIGALKTARPAENSDHSLPGR